MVPARRTLRRCAGGCQEVSVREKRHLEDLGQDGLHLTRHRHTGASPLGWVEALETPYRCTSNRDSRGIHYAAAGAACGVRA
eukprot:scaffold152069_cov33-Tisochrysis_lutea.AAC.2